MAGKQILYCIALFLVAGGANPVDIRRQSLSPSMAKPLILSCIEIIIIPKKTLKLRIKDKHATQLNILAGAVNTERLITNLQEKRHELADETTNDGLLCG